MDGLEVLNEIRRKRVDTPLVIITAHGTIERAVETMKEGADDFLTKPFDPDHLTIDRLFALNHLKTTTGCSERILLLHEGGTHRIRVDVRIVAATNRNIDKAVSDGSFREDLYHRVNVISITSPRSGSAGRHFRAGHPFLTVIFRRNKEAS